MSKERSLIPFLPVTVMIYFVGAELLYIYVCLSVHGYYLFFEKSFFVNFFPIFSSFLNSLIHIGFFKCHNKTDKSKTLTIWFIMRYHEVDDLIKGLLITYPIK